MRNREKPMTTLLKASITVNSAIVIEQIAEKTGRRLGEVIEKLLAESREFNKKKEEIFK